MPFFFKGEKLNIPPTYFSESYKKGVIMALVPTKWIFGFFFRNFGNDRMFLGDFIGLYMIQCL